MAPTKGVMSYLWPCAAEKLKAKAIDRRHPLPTVRANESI